MDPVMHCTTLPSHSSFSQQILVSFVMEIHTTSIDFLTLGTQRQSNLNKFKEARFKISPQDFKDHTLGEIVSFKYVFEHGSTESAGNLTSGEIVSIKILSKRGIECIFVGYAEHSKTFRFYVIEPNESILINSINEPRDAIFDENRFYSIPRPSLRIPNGTEDIGGSVVPKEKEASNDKMDSIMGNNTWVLADLPLVCKPLGCKWIFKRKLKCHKTADCFGINSQSDYSLDGCKDNFIECKFDETSKGVIICVYVDDMLFFGTDQVQVDLKKEFLSSRISIKDMGKADVILVSNPMNTSEKLMPNNGQAVSQLEYSRVIGCLMYTMTCIRPDIAFAVGKLSRLTLPSYPLVLEGYTNAS
ncbi:zinc finger, CCHC-type containing protein [Tanacetum coccineum]